MCWRSTTSWPAFLPAGFYYKTFMAPGWAWERLYEPLIRRAAGLGRLEAIVGEHAAPAETVHDHADVLVVGAGAAGLAAAHRLGASGLRVLLAEQDVVLGGGALLDARWSAWRETRAPRSRSLPQVRCLARTTRARAPTVMVYSARWKPWQAAEARPLRRPARATAHHPRPARDIRHRGD